MVDRVRKVLRILTAPLLALLALQGCSAAFVDGLAALQENNLGYVYCVEGSGPPLTGQGYVVAIGLKQGFQGVIAVKESCQIMVDHYLPYKEKVEELKPKSQTGGGTNWPARTPAGGPAPRVRSGG